MDRAINVISGSTDSGVWSTFHASADPQWLTVATVGKNGVGENIINIPLKSAMAVVKMMTAAAERAAGEQLTRAQQLVDMFAPRA